MVTLHWNKQTPLSLSAQRKTPYNEVQITVHGKTTNVLLDQKETKEVIENLKAAIEVLARGLDTSPRE